MRAQIDGATEPIFLSSGAEDYFLSAYCALGPPGLQAHLRRRPRPRTRDTPARVPNVSCVEIGRRADFNEGEFKTPNSGLTYYDAPHGTLTACAHAHPSRDALPVRGAYVASGDSSSRACFSLWLWQLQDARPRPHRI